MTAEGDDEAEGNDEVTRALRELAVAFRRAAARLVEIAATLDSDEPPGETRGRPPAAEGHMIDLSDDADERGARVISEELVGW